MANKEGDVRSVEVVRSFTRKINLGNYESADFFCSVKDTCHPDRVEALSEQLHDIAEDEVNKSIDAYLELRRRKRDTR